MEDNAAPKNDLTELRSHLFDTIRKLKDDKDPMELDRAKTIAGVASTVIASAKVEVEFIKATGQSQGSSFLQVNDAPQLPAPKTEEKPGILGRTVHRLK